jgi:guanylate kinase
MTTRAPRPGEREGEDYRFVSREAFEELIAADHMLEFAEVHGKLYGTPRSNLAEAREARTHLLLDIDVQGARQVRRASPDVVSIFILPPSGSLIVERLRSRASETDAELRARFQSAQAELEALDEFDYVVVNEDRSEATEAVIAIVEAEERAVRQLGERASARAIQIRGEIGRTLE